MDLGAICIGLLTALVVKLLVMYLGARLVLRLYRARKDSPHRLWILLPKEDAPEIRVLYWSLFLFFVAEYTCGVELYILLESSAILGSIHGIISGLGTGLFALGMVLYLDHKFIRYGGRQCLVNRVCKGCTIEEPIGCKFRVLLLFAGTFVALAALPALLVDTAPLYADATKYILPFDSLNAWYDNQVVPWLQANVDNYKPSNVSFFIPRAVMILEFRILPIIAFVTAIVGIGYLRGRHELRGLHIIAFSFGILCYVYLEVILLAATKDVFLGSLGHELVELWFLIATAEFLRRAYPPAPVEDGQPV